jgi:beta-galactosidase/beta-glucuronidase
MTLYPDLKKNGVEVRCHIENRTGRKLEKELVFQAVPAHHEEAALAVVRTTVQVPSEGTVISHFYPMGEEYRTWSEFTPDFYRMKVSLDRDALEKSFGMREFSKEGTQFTINGRKTFLRGTLECCIFPKTGYPPTDYTGWEKVFKAAKAYGLNHIRFHSWCPPEAAFEVADRMGFYLQPELPNWSGRSGPRKSHVPPNRLIEYGRILNNLSRSAVVMRFIDLNWSLFM